jgi:hypothetical protein
MNGTNEENNQAMLVFNGRKLCWWVIGPHFFYDRMVNPKIKIDVKTYLPLNP